MVVLAKVEGEWRKSGKWAMLQPEENEATLKPLRQAPRRLPLAKWEEAEKAIEEMKQQGLIKPQTVLGLPPWFL